MKEALISSAEKVFKYDNTLLGDRVAEVADQSFEVAAPLFWVSCPDYIVADKFYFDGNTFVEIPNPPRDIDEEWVAIRNDRDRRLAASDWSQLPDAQASMNDERKSAWISYRQVLRDITITFADPADVVWPVQPV